MEDLEQQKKEMEKYC